MDRITAIKTIIPGCSVSTDIIAGFCNETEEDHQDTLSLIEFAQFDFAFMYKYSVREGTDAAKTLPDNVPEETKLRRLNEIIHHQRKIGFERNKADVGKEFEILIEGTSKRSADQLSGRTSQNKVAVIPKKDYKPGMYVKIKITNCTAGTLFGEPID